MEKEMRLDKALAQMQIGSRSQVKSLIKKGRVLVNGAPIKKPEVKIHPESDVIKVDGQEIPFVTYEYIILHKPAGYVSATKDSKDPTVLDLIQDAKRGDLFPVGRLDKDTEGLLLLTNDGALAHDLLSPRKHVDKTYFARLEGSLPADARGILLAGIDIGEKKETLPADLKVLTPGENPQVEITIREGKYHQVKRMFAALGCQVVYLKRVRFGPLSLDETLAKGDYRRLSKEEIKDLKEGRS